MEKILMGPQTSVMPTPIVLVGANIDGEPNFMVVTWCGIANSEPPMLSVAIRSHRYTYRGIKQHMTFSANIPSDDMIKETVICGFPSASNVSKVELCQFRVFYGKLGDAPLIEQCPINLECKVVHILDLGSHLLIIGRIEETHIPESCIIDGRPDINKIRPLTMLNPQLIDALEKERAKRQTKSE